MMNREQFYNVTASDEYTSVYDGDTTKIPEKGTLVAIETASSGLVNAITTGAYNIRKSPTTVYRKLNPDHPRKKLPKDTEEFEVDSDKKGEFLISVEVKYTGKSGSTNTRWLDELHFPVLAREKKVEVVRVY